jgi:hypothetical protein
LNTQFSEQMPNEYKRKNFNLLSNEERHINTTLRSISPQSQWQLWKQRTINASEDVRKRALIHCYWECQQVLHIHFYWEFQQGSPHSLLLGMSTRVNHTLICGWKGVSPLCKPVWKLIKKKKKEQWKNLKRAIDIDPAKLLLAWIQRIMYRHPGATAEAHIYHSTIHYCQAVESTMTQSNQWKNKEINYMNGILFNHNECINYFLCWKIEGIWNHHKDNHKPISKTKNNILGQMWNPAYSE